MTSFNHNYILTSINSHIRIEVQNINFGGCNSVHSKGFIREIRVGKE
jgi:hypothetical protein